MLCTVHVCTLTVTVQGLIKLDLSFSSPQCESDTMDIQSIIAISNARDTKYLLEHLLDVAINLVSALRTCTCMLTCVSTHMYDIFTFLPPSLPPSLPPPPPPHVGSESTGE